ncbi:MAG: P1 family peptidase [Ilumatobacteraceae bacterium]
MPSNASRPPAPRPRARALGVGFGELPTGPHNAITDVPGVRVGHVTCWSDEPVARTGVTAILPCPLEELFARPPAAGVAVLNGVGELTGTISITELGFLDTPILLTGTPSVGRVYDAVVDAMFDAVPAVGDDDVVAPVVGECNDAWLDDSRRRNVSIADARTAIATATDGPVPEGVVGAGTGMITMEYKGGIGTSSRVLGGVGTIGVLVLANFGGRRQLRVGGVPVGRVLDDEEPGDEDPAHGDAGSCIGIVITDIPLDSRQLTRVARRVGLGLGRVGSIAGHGSGDIFCAVSVGHRVPRFTTGLVTSTLLADDDIGELFAATIDATEEAVTNALFVADTVVGRDGNTAPGLPVGRVLELL